MRLDEAVSGSLIWPSTDQIRLADGQVRLLTTTSVIGRRQHILGVNGAEDVFLGVSDVDDVFF